MYPGNAMKNGKLEQECDEALGCFKAFLKEADLSKYLPCE